MNSPSSAYSMIDGSELAGHRVVEAEERAAEQDVVAPGQLLVEAGAERQQPGDVAVDVDHALGRMDDPGEDLEERALAGAVRADDRQRLAVLDAQVDVAERPELLALAAPEHLAERPADRRLPGEPQVVADAEVVGADRVVGARIGIRMQRSGGSVASTAIRGPSRSSARAA